MSLEDVRTVERLLCCGSGAWAEATDHVALIMSKGVPVLIILSCKTFDVVITIDDWAFLRSFILMREHMRLEILENFAAIQVCATALLFGLVTAEWTILATIRLMRDKRWSSD